MTEHPHKEDMAKLFRKHSDMVYRTAYMLTKSRVLADDITQETFIQIIKKFHLYDSAKPIEPWMYKITINITRNMIRKHKLLNLVGVTTDISQGEVVEQEVLRGEWKSELWNEINQLSRKSKEVVYLHFYAELTLSEVAEVLKIPLGTCKSRLHYALTKIRQKYNGEWEGNE
ncbi:RNA polymerase sigma factor [Aquibacillus sp. 3ASR75-11]|uniref:RNA polymerase sigma factor n=1 Tax=Terrihalobacillus insolitus TaxID=2950438 RepID=A0A9X4AL03_9BACI|nr:RNA polymerase sigma factor [Terrihalobacillus insolitus]MDC3412868.1 RNA polymerase sigma factor [Terrihalobacillus insolitus]MDC3423656.1 RNA polymerase sigma factor [Terrihalobacillus insolitus]